MDHYCEYYCFSIIFVISFYSRLHMPKCKFLECKRKTFFFQLFEACFYGSRPIRCCDNFAPTYVMLRGRCFRLKEFYQFDPDEAGKLSLFFHKMPSPFVSVRGKQVQFDEVVQIQSFSQMPEGNVVQNEQNFKAMNFSKNEFDKRD